MKKVLAVIVLSAIAPITQADAVYNAKGIDCAAIATIAENAMIARNNGRAKSTMLQAVERSSSGAAANLATNIIEHAWTMPRDTSATAFGLTYGLACMEM